MTNIVLTVVCSALAAQSPEWKGVADALEAKHAEEASVSRVVMDGTAADMLAALRGKRPRYVAFVMRPEEVTREATVFLKRMMRAIDTDPYDDAIWGIVTGPTAADALRVASSREPREIRSVLATTGVGDDIVPGPVTCLSDAYPAGSWRVKSADGSTESHSSTGTVCHVFAEAWNTTDPQFLITSAHATEFNLEMPFSRGHIIPRDGRFFTYPDLAALAAPQREKVWLAAGNCLIANNKNPTNNMVMTALGFGKVNQFVGYIVETWFGEIGWNTWNYFGGYRYSLSESFYAANQWLLRQIDAELDSGDERRRMGLRWDRDVTVFYGDPMLRITLAPKAGRVPAKKKGEIPRIVIFPDSRKRAAKLPSPEWEVFTADDFALILEWPEHDVAEEAAIWSSVPDTEESR